MPTFMEMQVVLFWGIISAIMERVISVYLFIESHFEREKDFEKLDDLYRVSVGTSSYSKTS